MTGQEQDREEFFRNICRMEALAEGYREALRREKRREFLSPGAFAKRTFTERLKGRLRQGRRRLRAVRERVFRPALPSGKGQTAPGAKAERQPVPGGLALDRQKAGDRKPLYFREERIAVYTALFGSYDTVREPLLAPDNIDYYLFTDQDVPEGSLWQRPETAALIPEAYLGDPVLANRWCKMHPHELFPEHDYSIYIDANIWVLSDLTPLAAGLDSYPAAMFRHKKRDCVYEEVQACIDQKKDTEEALRAHEKTIRARGIPKHWGLLEASVIARKHHDPRCVSFMEAWWEAFLKNSRRDQISLIDCLWQAGLTPGTVGTLGGNLQRCDLFLQMRHPKEGIPQPRDLKELKAFIRG